MNDHFCRRTNPRSVKLQTAMGAVLLTLMAVAAPLHAQAPTALAFGLETCRPGVRRKENCLPTPHAAGPLHAGRCPLATIKNSHSTAASKSDPAKPSVLFRGPRRPDFNNYVYYRNKLEFSVQSGWMPNNIPFPFDFLLGSGYNMTPLKYTLVPVNLNMQWQLDNLGGPSILRGNWEATFGANYTDIARGPETRAFFYTMGIWRNFVQRNWRIAPYLGGDVGTGDINSKEPAGVLFAQGQDFTFTLRLGSGVRYNINPHYAIEAGVGYMHISNLYLSEPKYLNYGINVYGPTFGFVMRLGKPRRQSPEQ